MLPIIKKESIFKLLLVEDHKTNQIVAKKTLIKQWPNIIIEIANDGYEAIDALRKSSFHIILMDIQMPKMNGYDATQFIRTKFAEEKSKIPILAMTAHANIAKDNQYKANGMDDYVLKPFVPDNLFEKISKFVLKRL